MVNIETGLLLISISLAVWTNSTLFSTSRVSNPPTLKMDIRNDFQGEFNPEMYLNKYYKRPGSVAMMDFALKNIHKFFNSAGFSEDKPVKVLDYACGPVLSCVISAAGLNTEIILADYTDKCREAIQQWLDLDPSARDWSLYFKFIVQTLEGKEESEVLKREESLRNAVKAVVPCDITQDPPIARGFEGPYDVVMTILCFESACTTRDEYRAAVRKIAPLVKVGGHFLLYSTIRNKEGLGYYHIGPTRFVDLCLPLQFILSTLEESEFTVSKHILLPEKDSLDIQNQKTSDTETTAFFVAMRCK